MNRPAAGARPAGRTPPKDRTAVIAVLLGGFVLAWYFRPYPWLGAVLGIAAGGLAFSILRSGRIERWRRVLFISLTALFTLTLLTYIFSIGGVAFRQSVAAWNPGYYFPGIGSSGTLPFPTPIVMPSMFWRGASFMSGAGVWFAPIPTSLGLFLGFMLPVLLLSLAFGRGLCGWVCPLGGLPELAASLGRETRLPDFLEEKRTSDGGVSYTVLKPWVHRVRYGIMAGVILLSFGAGFAVVNLFYPVLWLKSMPAFWAVAGTLAVFAVALPLATRRRWWCFVCPVGAVLSAIDRFTLFRMRIDRSKCNRCMDCVRACRYYALTPQGVEHGQSGGGYCVRCGRCLEACSEQAIDVGWIGSLKKARGPFVAVVLATAFVLCTWYAVLLVSLASHAGGFRWLS